MTKWGESVSARLKRYFAENPGEWLTFDDICSKFQCTEWTATRALKELRAAGLAIERESVYFVKAKAK